MRDEEEQWRERIWKVGRKGRKGDGTGRMVGKVR